MRKLTQNMDSLSKTDPTIYSTNHSFHMERVLTENYAYIGDTTAFELAMSQLCDIDMIRDQFAPAQYAAALQKHSAYVPLVNHEYVLLDINQSD